MESLQSRSAKKSYIEPQVNVMTGCHRLIFCSCLIPILYVLLAACTLTPAMYVYNDGETYSCPTDSASERGEQILKSASFVPELEDNFLFDPMDCEPFYRDPEEPIWYGRVDNLNQYN